MNHGVSENSDYSMKLKKNVPFSTLNAIIKELPTNFVENLAISEETVYLQLLDLLRYLLKEESLFIKKMSLVVKR